MRAVIQRVTKAQITVNEDVVGQIDDGLLVFLGIAENDDHSDLQYIVRKTMELRLFQDSNGKMNLSVVDVGGEILAVPQFTLCGDCRKGRRPSFTDAASPEKAEMHYNKFVSSLRDRGAAVQTGSFQEHMEVELLNNGPVTLLLDSSKDF